MARPRSAGRQRPMWILLMLAGGFGVWAGGQIGGEDEALDHFHDTSSGEYVSVQLQAGSEQSAGNALLVAGGIVFFLGFFAFVRSFADDGERGLGTEAPNLFAAAGLKPEDITPELLAAAGLRAEDLPPGMTLRDAEPTRPRPLPSSGASVPFDPTFWTHPAALLYVFEDRPATGFYELARGLRDQHLRGSGLLVAVLQALDSSRRKVVAVLGSDDAVRAFDRAFQGDVGARVETGELDWRRLRPDLQLQKESYDPRFVVEDPSQYEALRQAIRRAEYMVLAADGG